MSNKQSKFRKLVPGRCRYCDRQFFYRQSARPKFFCDGKCRQADFRHTRYLGSKRNEGVPKTQVKSKTSEPIFADRPLNLLGGYRWPNTAPLDREVVATIIDTEVGPDRRHPRPLTLTADQRRQADALINSIPDDLSIPDFLKRS